MFTTCEHENETHPTFPPLKVDKLLQPFSKHNLAITENIF